MEFLFARERAVEPRNGGMESCRQGAKGGEREDDLVLQLPVNDELDILWKIPGHFSDHVAFEQSHQFVPVG